MSDETKTREELLAEMTDLRRGAAELEKAARAGRKTLEKHEEYLKRIEEEVEERTAEIRLVNRQLTAEAESRKRAEEQLGIVASQWRDTLDAVTDAIWLMDLDQTIIRCNKAAARFLKKDYLSIIGRKCFDLVHGGLGPVEGCPFLRMYSSKRREVVRLPSGDRWLSVSVTPLKNKEGKVTGAIHVVSDVTRARRAAEEMKESGRRLANILEGVGEGLLILDRECRVTYASKRAERLLGGRGGPLAGTSLSVVFPGEEGEMVLRECMEALNTGKPRQCALSFASRPGPVEAHIHPFGAGEAAVCLHIP